MAASANLSCSVQAIGEITMRSEPCAEATAPVSAHLSLHSCAVISPHPYELRAETPPCAACWSMCWSTSTASKEWHQLGVLHPHQLGVWASGRLCSSFLPPFKECFPVGAGVRNEQMFSLTLALPACSNTRVRTFRHSHSAPQGILVLSSNVH